MKDKKINEHAIDRAHQRYNFEINKQRMNDLISKIKMGEYLFISKSAENCRREFAYVKINNLPLKVLFNRSKSGAIDIITIYPFDVDEYNKLVEKKKVVDIANAVKLLKENKFIVYKRKEK